MGMLWFNFILGLKFIFSFLGVFTIVIYDNEF